MYSFFFLYVVSFILVMSSNDWFMVWVGLEINMMSFLVLVYRRGDLMNIESCLKYFFIQSLGSALLIGMFYLSYDMMGGFMSLILSYSIGAGPFYYWFPSLCSGLNWICCYVLMLFQKFLPLLLMSLFVHWILWFVIIIGLIMGVMGSFNQSDISQLMAYSSVHHLGWIMMILMKGDLSWFLYLLLYGVMLFSIFVLMINDETANLTIMFSSKSKNLFMLGMMSMGGMPPLLGFFLKWMALVELLSFSMIYIMILIMVSVIMLYVYIRIVYDVFLGGGDDYHGDFNMLKYNHNMENLSLIGILLGMLLGICMVM